MNQLTNYKHKIDFLISNDASLIKSLQTNKCKKYKKYNKCSKCKKNRKPSDKDHQICRHCYNFSKLPQSGNKVIDDFVEYTNTNLVIGDAQKMNFVPYDKFEDVEFIAEGGFSKIYKATWIAGKCQHVVLKKLNNSKNITSKELNELRVSYEFSIKRSYSCRSGIISEYYGITQDTTTQEIMIIMPYYDSGDLIYYITKDFYNISWEEKLNNLNSIIYGLHNLHLAKITHRDLHSGNILCVSKHKAIISDLGLSKSATTKSTDSDNETYGIIPYMAPEIFQGQEYTEKSDIYSFGMIMWEVMTGRRPFWDRNHDADLIIEIVDGLRPPIVTNAPEGYVELMKECWHPDPEKRPTAKSIWEWPANKIYKIILNEQENPTKIIKSPDIGPVSYNSGAIYKSRPLSCMINSAMSTRSLRTQSTGRSHYLKNSTNFIGKIQFLDVFNSTGDDNDDDKKKLPTNEKNGYLTEEFEFDIDTNINQICNDNEYKTKEINFDI